MRVGQFSVFIPEGREMSSGHVSLKHGQQYTVKVINHNSVEADAEITIDGKIVGCFRIAPRRDIQLERNPNDRGRFTFYKLDSVEGQQINLAQISANDLGLVQVVCKPAKKKEEIPILRSAGGQHTNTSYSRGGPRGQSMGGEMATMSAGGTGLSGHSSQNFVEVGPIDYDLEGIVTISLRLVEEDNQPREMKANNEKANPVPSVVNS